MFICIKRMISDAFIDLNIDHIHVLYNVCVDVPFSNSMGIALIYTTSKFNILYLWF